MRPKTTFKTTEKLLFTVLCNIRICIQIQNILSNLVKEAQIFSCIFIIAASIHKARKTHSLNNICYNCVKNGNNNNNLIRIKLVNEKQKQFHTQQN